jgi:hypothetical protein
MNLDPKEEAALHLIEKGSSYENYFFNKIVNIKWFYPLKERDYFSPEKAPGVKRAEKGGFYIPRWNILPYLERISEQFSIKENEGYINELLEIIREVSKYKNSNGQPIDNYRTWYSFVKILSNLPNRKIPDDIIDLIPIWLNSKFDTALPGREIIRTLLPKFLTNEPEDIKKAERIVNYITDFTISPLDNDDKRSKLKIEYHYLKEGFEKYSEEIGKKCTDEVIKELKKKIKKIINNRKEQGTYQSFYENLEYLDEPLDMYTFILKRILISKAQNDIYSAKKILREFLKDDYLYFPKIALFIIGNVFEKYRDFFWEILESDIENIIFKNYDNFGDELKHILENLKELTKQQREILIKKINDSVKPEDFRENRELMINLHKQKFYKALSNDQFFNEQYKKLKDITNYDIELRPIIGKVEFGPAPNISPLSKEEILQMSNRELAEFLSNFKGDKHWKGPSVNGLSKLLLEIAKEIPKKFTDDMPPFMKTGYLYVSDIIWGICNAWEDNIPIEWNNLLKYIKEYISQDDFWNDKYIVKDDYRSANHFWVLGSIGELIKKGIIDDNKYFSEQNYPLVQDILFLILDNLFSDKKKVLESQTERKDYISYALNSTFGKIAEALLLLAYRIKKIENKTKNEQSIGWEKSIKVKYKELLEKDILESYVWLGLYLTIVYLLLDKRWTITKIDSICSAEERIWEAFMQGYLYSNRINKDIYKIMKAHYKKAIDFKFKEDISSKRLVQNICYMYLEGLEDINNNDGLFRIILDKWDKVQIKEVISWFWMQRNYILKSIDEKEKPREKARMESMRKGIINFWKWINENKFKEKSQSGNLNDIDKEILSELSKLTVFIEKIDRENYEWLKISAPYLNVDFNTSFFLKYLDDLKDKDEDAACYVGELFLEILKHSTPNYDQENIRSIVEHLCKKGHYKNAIEICDTYGEREHYFLRDIRENCKLIK